MNWTGVVVGVGFMVIFPTIMFALADIRTQIKRCADALEKGNQEYR